MKKYTTLRIVSILAATCCILSVIMFALLCIIGTGREVDTYIYGIVGSVLALIIPYMALLMIDVAQSLQSIDRKTNERTTDN